MTRERTSSSGHPAGIRPLCHCVNDAVGIVL